MSANSSPFLDSAIALHLPKQACVFGLKYEKTSFRSIFAIVVIGLMKSNYHLMAVPADWLSGSDLLL